MPHRSALGFVIMLAMLLAAESRAQQPTPGAISKGDRERALGILDGVSKGIQSLYYDPKMNGLDWKAVRGHEPRSCSRIRLVAATVDSPAFPSGLDPITGLVEHAIFSKEFVDGRTPTNRVVFTENVAEIAGHQR